MQQIRRFAVALLTLPRLRKDLEGRGNLGVVRAEKSDQQREGLGARRSGFVVSARGDVDIRKAGQVSCETDPAVLYCAGAPVGPFGIE